MIDAVIRKPVAIESRQTFAGAEPEKAARIAHYLVDDVIGEAVGDSVGFERQPLAERALRTRQTESGATYCEKKQAQSSSDAYTHIGLGD